MLILRVDDEGLSASVIDEAGAIVASGALALVQGGVDVIKASAPGTEVRCDLYFEGTVV